MGRRGRHRRQRGAFGPDGGPDFPAALEALPGCAVDVAGQADVAAAVGASPQIDLPAGAADAAGGGAVHRKGVRRNRVRTNGVRVNGVGGGVDFGFHRIDSCGPG